MTVPLLVTVTVPLLVTAINVHRKHYFLLLKVTIYVAEPLLRYILSIVGIAMLKCNTSSVPDHDGGRRK